MKRGQGNLLLRRFITILAVSFFALKQVIYRSLVVPDSLNLVEDLDDGNLRGRTDVSHVEKIMNNPGPESGSAIDDGTEEEVDESSSLKMYHDWDFSYIKYEYFDCDEKNRPIIPQSDWIKARETYISQPSSPPKDLHPDPKINGFSIPVEARKAPGKGRGVFTLRDIKKGELVWNPTQTAKFSTGGAFKDFIFSLDNNFVCDALNFSYVQNVKDLQSDEGKDEDKYMVLVDLDEGALCNSADYYEKDNIGCSGDMADGYEGGCLNNYFAIRDIAAGEELLCDYDAFQEGPGSWKRLDL